MRTVSFIFVLGFLCAALHNSFIFCDKNKDEVGFNVFLPNPNSSFLVLTWPDKIDATRAGSELLARKIPGGEFAKVLETPTPPIKLEVDNCSTYEFRLDSEGGTHAKNFSQATRLQQYETNFQIVSQVLKPEGIVISIRFDPLPAGFKPKFDLSAFSAASGPTPTVVQTGPTSGRIIVDGKNMERVERGENSWFILILRAFEDSCGNVVHIESARNHQVINIMCQKVQGLTCRKEEHKNLNAYCHVPTVVSFPLARNRIFVSWKFDDSDDTFPNAPILKYAIRYGPVINGDSATLNHRIDAVNGTFFVDATRNDTILRFPIDCTQDYKIQICAVFDKEPDDSSWHLLNSHNLSTALACEWNDDYWPSIVERMLNNVNVPSGLLKDQ